MLDGGNDDLREFTKQEESDSWLKYTYLNDHSERNSEAPFDRTNVEGGSVLFRFLFSD